jgi:hypothetical protein
MKSVRILIAAVVLGGLFSYESQASVLPTATITATVDGQASPPIPCYFETSADGYRGKWMIGTPGYNEFEWDYDADPDSGNGASVELRGALDPDPSIGFALGVIDVGAPSNFSFTFTLPLNPIVPNPSYVFDSLTGTVTAGAGAGGVTVTALAPPVGIPEDGDGTTELQVFTISSNNGGAWQNVGLDAGPSQSFAIPQFTPAIYGPPLGYNQGPIPTIAGGPWTDMRVDLNFGLSGGNDQFSLSGEKTLQVPEPGGLLAPLIALMFGALRRKR